jgi:geranylgeranylglycerol-phosphate geranylgeranyltransferase
VKGEGRALLEACRPLNAGMAVVACGLGAWLAGGTATLSVAVLPASATALSLAAGNVWNDLADQAEDRINRPRRPLVSGRLRPATARAGAALLALAGLACAALVGLESLLFVLACQVALAWYARRGKQAGLAGTAVVAALGGLAVGYGALAAAWADPGALPSRAAAPASLATLLHALRELVKDLEDRQGDLAAGRRSWVLRRSGPAPRSFLTRLGLLCLLPPLLALGLLSEPMPLQVAHGIALLLPLLLFRRLSSLDLESRPRLTAFSRWLKSALAAGLLLYGLAALLS